MKKKYFFIMLIMTILFLTITAISAQDNTTDLDDVDDSDVLSQKVELSNLEDETPAENDANESGENNYNDSTSDNLNGSDAGDLNESGEVILNNTTEGNESGQDPSNTSEENESSVIYTFTDLNNKIQSAKSILYLSGTYKYNKKTDADFKMGVKIRKDLKIIGVGKCVIDGAGLARCLKTSAKRTITLENIVIKNGYVKNENGAGILISKNVKITFKNCVFQNNVVYNANGGAMSVSQGDKVIIKSCKFIKNNAKRVSSKSWNKFKAGMGGAILATIGTTVKIYDSSFKSNKAYLSIILSATESKVGKITSYLYAKKCTFEKNKSHKDGVIYSDEYGKCKIVSCVFKKNTSPSGSGTIICDTSVSAVIDKCVFDSNKVHSGGGICIRVVNEKLSSHVKITNCKFTKNHASALGGAIFSVCGKVKVKNCKFTKNTASQYGGAIYFRAGNLKLSKCKFSKNKSPHDKKITKVPAKT